MIILLCAVLWHIHHFQINIQNRIVRIDSMFDSHDYEIPDFQVPMALILALVNLGFMKTRF